MARLRMEVSNLLLLAMIGLSAAAIPVVAYLIFATPVEPPLGEEQEEGPSSALQDIEAMRKDEPWSADGLRAVAGESGPSLLFSDVTRNVESGSVTAKRATLWLRPFTDASRLDLDDGLSRLLARLPKVSDGVKVERLDVGWDGGAEEPLVLWSGRGIVDLGAGSLVATMDSGGDGGRFTFKYIKRSGMVSLDAPELQEPVSVELPGGRASLAFSGVVLESGRRLLVKEPVLASVGGERELFRASKVELVSSERLDLTAEALEAPEWFSRLADGAVMMERAVLSPEVLDALKWVRLPDLVRQGAFSMAAVALSSSGAVSLRGVAGKVGEVSISLEEADSPGKGDGGEQWQLSGGAVAWGAWGLKAAFKSGTLEQRRGNGPKLAFENYSLEIAPSPMAMLPLLSTAKEVKRIALDFFKSAPHVPTLIFPWLPDFTLSAVDGTWTIPMLGGAAIEGLEVKGQVRGGVVEEARLGLCRGEQCSDLALTVKASTDPSGVLTQATFAFGGELPLKAVKRLMPGFVKGLDALSMKFELRKPDSSGLYRWNLKASLGGLKAFHPMVSDSVLEFPPVELSGSGKLDLEQQLLESSFDRIMVGGALVRASIDIKGISKRPWVRLGLDVPEQDCGRIGEAVPKGLAPRLAQARFEGNLGFNFLFEADLQNVRKTLKLDFDGEFTKCSVDFGGAFRINRLNSENFVHRVVVNGEDLGLDVGPGTPFWVPLAEIPLYTQQAAYGTEDLAFYSHRGFRLGLIKRAIILLAERGRFVYGGSTISQQLVKNLFLSREKTLARKFEEAIIVWQMEQHVGKERILELYLNCIEYGPKIWGIVRASKEYFNKTPGQLSIIESAFLMGLKPDPAYGYLQFRRGKLNKHWRKNLEHVLKRLLEMKAIDEETFKNSMSQELVFNPPGSELPPLELPQEEDRPVREGQEEAGDEPVGGIGDGGGEGPAAGTGEVPGAAAVEDEEKL